MFVLDSVLLHKRSASQPQQRQKKEDNMQSKWKQWVAGAALVLGSSVVVADSMDIVDTAVASGQFTTLVKAVQEAGLVETLKGEGPFTVFAPTDEAFAKLPEGALEALLNDKDQLRAVLTYHVVAGKVMAADVQAGEVTTVQGDTLEITITDGNVMVDQANVIATDVEASNGVIHVLDSVVLPNS